MADLEAMWDAIYDDDCDRITRLIDEGLGVDSRVEGDEWNYLHMALVSVSIPASPKVVEHLISLGVDVSARDRKGYTPLHFASRVKNHKCCNLLLDAGSPVNAPNDEGVTPLHQSLLTMPADLELIQLLLDHGADPFDEYNGCCAMKYVEVISCDDKEQIVELFTHARK